MERNVVVAVVGDFFQELPVAMTRGRQNRVDLEGVQDIFNRNGGAVAPFCLGVQVDGNLVFAASEAVGKHRLEFATQLVVGEQSFVGNAAVAVNGKVGVVIQRIKR